MKLLVCGGAGLLGAAVSRRLLDAGHTVAVADAFAADGDGRAARGARAAALKDRGASIRRLDLADADAVRGLLDEFRPEVLVNAARLPADVTVEPLLAASREKGVAMLVHVSDADLYGAAPEPGVRAREEEPLDPGSDARLLARAWDEGAVREGAVPWVILRAFELVSGDLPPGRPIRDLADAVLGGRPVPLPDNEGRDLLHVDDAARAVHLVVTRRPIGRTINLGSGMAVSLRALAEEIATCARRDVSFAAVPPPSRPPRVADTSAAWDALRFGPEIALPRIAAQLAASRPVPSPERPVPAPEPAPAAPAVSRREIFGIFRKPFSRKQ